MRQERQEGYFDEFGHYVRRKEEEDVRDAWLDSLGEDRIVNKPKMVAEVQVCVPFVQAYTDSHRRTQLPCRLTKTAKLKN